MSAIAQLQHSPDNIFARLRGWSFQTGAAREKIGGTQVNESPRKEAPLQTVVQPSAVLEKPSFTVHLEGSTFVTVFSDGTVNRFDLEKNVVITTAPDGTTETVDAKARVAITNKPDGTIELFDLATRILTIRRLDGTAELIHDAEFRSINPVSAAN